MDRCSEPVYVHVEIDGDSESCIVPMPLALQIKEQASGGNGPTHPTRGVMFEVPDYRVGAWSHILAQATEFALNDILAI